jgi:hypothetical protein
LCLDPLGRFFQLELPLPVGRLLHLLQLLLLFEPLLSFLVLSLSLSDFLLQFFTDHKLLALTGRLRGGHMLLLRCCLFLLSCILGIVWVSGQRFVQWGIWSYWD